MNNSASTADRSGSAARLRRSTALGLAVGVIATAPFVAAAPATAGKGSGKPAPSTGSSLTLVLVDPGDTVVNWGERITFKVSTTATTEPHVSVKCHQGGTLVYTSETGYYAGYPWPSTQIFTLKSGAWTSGAADCSAVLYWFNGPKTVTGYTLPFTVAA